MLVMPDFLHASQQPTAPEPESGRTDSTRRERRRFLRQPTKQGGDGPRVNIRPSEPVRQSSTASIRKKPRGSALFVRYYGATFFLLVSVFAFIGYRVFQPLIQRFKETNERIQTTLTEIDDGNRFLDSVNASIAAAESIDPDTILRIDEALPKREDTPKMLKMFSKIADSSEVSISSIQFSRGTASKDDASPSEFSLIPISIGLSVTSPGYLAMRDFLHNLETNVRLLEANSISVTPNEGTGEFSYTLDMTAYALQKRETPSLPATAPAPPAADPGLEDGAL